MQWPVLRPPGPIEEIRYKRAAVDAAEKHTIPSGVSGNGSARGVLLPRIPSISARFFQKSPAGLTQATRM